MIHHDIDVVAIRREYERTHTGTGSMTAGTSLTNVPKVDVTDAEADFGLTLDAYKRLAHRPHPTYGEVLAVIVALGYRLVAPPAPLKQRPKYPEASDGA